MTLLWFSRPSVVYDSILTHEKFVDDFTSKADQTEPCELRPILTLILTLLHASAIDQLIIELVFGFSPTPDRCCSFATVCVQSPLTQLALTSAINRDVFFSDIFYSLSEWLL
jgi:hypothetical protein